jgi:peptidoglycan/xylan/chitin deacetylase (PgdA/CDA1 family)
MKAITLLYHDVVRPGEEATSGFSSADADIYKLYFEDFEKHLDAIGKTENVPDVTIHDFLSGEASNSNRVPVLLSFDDGGKSAPATADLLDRRGWKGHFFVTTDVIGSPAFMTKEDVREVRKRGHVIGSHSCSHPRRISHLNDSELQHEWRDSIAALEEILGEEVDTASVPGGFYSGRVLDFATRAGARILFNSEPVVGISRKGNCTLVGRFGLQRSSPPGLAAKYAGRDSATLWKQAAYWNAKKMIKAVGGERWLAFRKWWLAR